MAVSTSRMAKELLSMAILDDRLNRGHLKVLSVLVDHLNSETGKCWPSRNLIASRVGCEAVSVSNRLLELHKIGYFTRKKERVTAAGNRVLTVYTIGKFDRDQDKDGQAPSAIADDLKSLGRKAFWMARKAEAIREQEQNEKVRNT